MDEIWDKILEIRGRRLGLIPSEAIPQVLRKQLERHIARLENQSNESRLHLDITLKPPEARSKIIAAWAYSAIGEYNKAIEELRTIELESRTTQDDHFLLTIELLALLLNTTGQFKETLELYFTYTKRFSSQVPQGALRFLNGIGIANLWLSEYKRALELFELASSIALEFGDMAEHAGALSNIAIVQKNLGNLPRAFEYAQRAMDLTRERDPRELAPRLIILSNTQFWTGRFGAALKNQTEALPLTRRSKNPRDRCACLIAIGRSNLALRSHRQARNLLLRAGDIAREQSLPREQALAHEFLGDLECAEGNPDKGGEHYSQGMKIALEIAPRGDLVTEIGRRLAEWHLARGEHANARLELERALDLAVDISDRREEAILYRVKARLMVATGGRRQSAESALQKSIDILGGMGARFEESLSRAELGRIRISAPRRSRHHRLKGIDDLCAAATVVAELELPERQGELLIEAVERGEGLLDPDDSLGLLREAELVLRPFRESGCVERIGKLRRDLESEIARRAMEDEKMLLNVRESSDTPIDRSLQVLSSRLSAKRAFIFLRDAPEGTRTLGCDSVEALPALDRLPFPERDGLVVSAGDLTGEGSECYGPYVAYRNAEIDGIVYVERPLGSVPFSEQEAGEFASYSSRLLERIPAPTGMAADRDYPRVVTQSANMRDLIDRIAFLRNSMASVLIRGETGTGKGILAQLLHDLGDRARTGRIVQVHCAELPETLIESELFGHVRGAFTGAFSSKQGLIELAEGGTLFLDEIGDLSPAVQLRLLRVIEEKRLKRVGESRDREVNIRIIAATHRNLEVEIERDNFREDLYYRLNVISLVVPPLRDRRDDVPLLTEHFLTSFARQEGKHPPDIDEEAMRRLKLYSWPGNVRELQNEMRRLAALLHSRGTIRVSDLSERILYNGKASRFLRRPGRLSFQKQQGNLQDALDSLEQEWIREALVEGKGKAKTTAEILGISPQLLRYKMKKYGFTLPGRE